MVSFFDFLNKNCLSFRKFIDLSYFWVQFLKNSFKKTCAITLCGNSSKSRKQHSFAFPSLMKGAICGVFFGLWGVSHLNGKQQSLWRWHLQCSLLQQKTSLHFSHLSVELSLQQNFCRNSYHPKILLTCWRMAGHKGSNLPSCLMRPHLTSSWA